MNKLNTLIEKFKDDEDWNTSEKDGSRRFDTKLKWLRKMVEQYAEKLNMSIGDVVDNFENNRSYSWPNYYQEANFPNLDEVESITVYETLDEFKLKNKKFKCPACENIYTHPRQCEHRIKQDGKCDWTAGGLFQIGLHHVVIKDKSLVPIAIFEPVKE
jgi:hypothetical protein